MQSVEPALLAAVAGRRRSNGRETPGCFTLLSCSELDICAIAKAKTVMVVYVKKLLLFGHKYSWGSDANEYTLLGQSFRNHNAR